jgi:23S rRNA pseudouridine1911/1915/1917 synthase
VARPDHAELPTGERIPILYEDRAVLALDKPRGWLLAPGAWRQTGRNLQASLAVSIAAGDFWARSRGLKFLRYVHRLDADTTGVLLFVRSPGAAAAYSRLFESRNMDKTYLAAVAGVPKAREWTCALKIGDDPMQRGRMRVDPRHGKPAETRFRVLAANPKGALIEARPLTGRTHQIRVHLAAGGLPVAGDELYGPQRSAGPLALRAVGLRYTDPFTRRRVEIVAPSEEFVRARGFELSGS